MILKDYQVKVIKELKHFFTEAEKQKNIIDQLPESVRGSISYVDSLYKNLKLDFADRPENGLGQSYPRFCLKVPTAGGKTLIAVEAIREYQNLFTKKRTGIVVWITHRDTIYSQTIKNLKNKSHIYRQWLDQCSGNKTIILEKGHPLRSQDVEENLVVLMIMIQSANRSVKEDMKIFMDSGGYMDFFPADNQYDEHKKLLEQVPNLDFVEDSLFNRKVVKTSLGNAIRMSNPLIIVDEFHTMFSDKAKATLDQLNPAMIIGLSATPKERMQMNVLVRITGQELKRADMIKLDLHLKEPTKSGNWHEMTNEIIDKRDSLEKEAKKLQNNRGIYIRPIALIQVERTGKDQRGKNFVHSEDVREYLVEQGVPSHQIAVKSSDINEIAEENLLSESSEIRYIITKEALKEGWDCSFAYILGVIPNAKSETSMTQLIGRILRQPYAQKTGIPALDESYVYYTKGEIADVLYNIQKGFDDEGLGDLVQHVGRESGPTGSRRVKVKIKNQIRKQFPESLFLPVWLIKEGNKHRHFSYDIDIKSNLNWQTTDYAAWLEKEILPHLSEKVDRHELLVDLDKKFKKVVTDEKHTGLLELSYLTRRIFEIVDNAFLSAEISEKIIRVCDDYANKEVLSLNSGFITKEIVKKIIEDKSVQEKRTFDSLINSGKLIIGVSDSQELGYSLPYECEVYPEVSETYSLNLYEKSDILSMNSLEKRVANLIDSNQNVIWWVRNMAERKEWYAINGWKRGRIRPDFVVAKRGKNNSLELVYIIESKGEQLMGNEDTMYKQNVFTKMNGGNVEPINYNLIKFKLNKKFQFELVEQGEEELKINILL